jgi:hypothetical protein
VTATECPACEGDSLPELWAQRSCLVAQLHGFGDQDCDPGYLPLLDSLTRIEDRIAASVALSPSGAIVQLRLLREHLDAEPFAEQIVDNLIAGLEHLGGSRRL